MSAVFVSYRQNHHVGDRLVRRCHAQVVEAVAERLARHFGQDQVFIDTTGMPSSVRYPDALRERLAASEVVVAVIHEDWLADLDARRERLAPGEQDWVRLELATAFATGKPVLPVLLGDARLPGRAELPDDIDELAVRQAHRVQFGRWAEDLERLIQHVELHVTPEPLPHQPEPVAPPHRHRWGPALAAALGLVAPGVVTWWAEADPVEEFTWLLALSTVLAGVLAIPLAVVAVTYLLRGWLDSLEAHATSVTQDTRTNVIVGLSVGGLAAVFLLTNEMFPPSAQMLLLAVIVGIVITSGARWLRERRTAATWPRPHLAPDPAAIRGALAEVRDHLDRQRPPLTRQRRDQARFALDQIRHALERLRERDSVRRLGWLAAATPALTVPHALLAATVAGTAITALAHGWSADTAAVASPWWPVGCALAAVALYAATLELCYRLLRWRRRVIGRTVPEAVTELAERLRAASTTAPRRAEPR